LPVNQFSFYPKTGTGVTVRQENVSAARSCELYPEPIRLDWPPMEDGGDVLGNLPRTRPGRRSEKRAAKPKEAPRRRAPEPPPPEPDPVGDAIRTAAGAAVAGLRVTHGITREVLRRLPRP
jgi:hypothetical protein